MKTVALMFISAVIVTGCSRPVVIERPVVLNQGPATGGSAATAACTYASQAYSHGSVSCQDRNQYRCENGVWNRTMNPC